MPSKIRKIAVLGAGLMGTGIAEVLARSGYSVVVRDVDDSFLQRGVGMLQASMRRALERGKITQQQYDAAFAGIKMTTDLKEALVNAEVIVEAVPEDVHLKKRLFQEVEPSCSSQAIIASNTSAISITDLASVLGKQDRFIGMHWFNPAPIMKLIEIVRGANTSDETVETIRMLAEACGKVPVVINDTPGFISSRVHVLSVMEAIRALEEGVGTPDAIDQICKLGYNLPMGPLELADLIGLDTLLHIYDYLSSEYGERFRAPQLLKRMVRAGKCGKKTGVGFYDWTKKSAS